ncbi:MAG: cytochrome P460 family protein [Marivibrio sp.]|uniref:cytochrome P460 family protein n=1 Tax=Marivibrio sp. TaxID=2039719 RepID=UPI0032EBEEEA
MTRFLRAACLASVAAGVGLAVLGADRAHAACDVDKPRAEMSYEDAQAVWECLKDDLYAGYNAGPKRWIPKAFVEDYRDWGLASTLPADPGFHSGRYLLTYVNETGFDAYTEFAEGDDVTVPAGTVIAKESFTVTEDGAARKGPLFFMQKVEAGVSPETDDWYYMMVAPGGQPMAINVYTACSQCHQETFAHQGGMGYPVPEVRVSK